MNASAPTTVSGEELDRFLIALIHALRNRLNLISLEAANLAEEAEGRADAAKLQQHIADYAAFLKELHRQAAHDDPPEKALTLAELTRRLQRHEKK